MKDQVTKPIFVVGSPRSGTTVIAYCICQHPNILYQEDSDWLGPFAIDAAVNHRRGSARGPRGQLRAIGVGREEFLMSFGQSINELILSHRKQFQSRRAQWDLPPCTISRSPEEPKSRWVAGEAEFDHLVQYFHDLGRNYSEAQRLIITLQKELEHVKASAAGANAT
jgi:Sulfotransferase family